MNAGANQRDTENSKNENAVTSSYYNGLVCELSKSGHKQRRRRLRKRRRIGTGTIQSHWPRRD